MYQTKTILDEEAEDKPPSDVLEVSHPTISLQVRLVYEHEPDVFYSVVGSYFWFACLFFGWYHLSETPRCEDPR